MKSKKISFFFIAGIVIVLSIVFSGFILSDDDPVINKIVNQLNNWLDSHPTEKVYLQIDKPYYAAGDNIWFKAYIMVGSQHRLSALSGIVNVELIDEKDSVKKWIKLPVIGGTAWGNIKLSDTLHEGTYRIRAYTNWMRNAGSDYYFDDVITIVAGAANTVFTKTNYTYTSVKGQQKVTATINYTDVDGNAYIAKPISYKVQFNNKVTAKGKGITDDKGNIVIDFTYPASTQVNKGNITTDITLTEKSTVTKTMTLNATGSKANIQFFPESGNMVNGLNSRVAFKAVGANGLGISIKGVITDDKDNKICEFGTQHLGLGSFTITPQSGKTYKAVISYADGSENTVDLPAALNTGYVLSINNKDKDNISLNVMGSNGLADAGKIYLFAQSGGEIYYVAQNQASSRIFKATIPTSRFPSGIVQFTLFSASGEPLNERIAFIQHDENLLKLNITSAKSVSAPREKVRIDMDAQNGGKPVIGSFSATVIDDDKVKNDESEETTVLSYILLTSDLRGYIEQPNYYFNKSNETTRADLDVLMLTQGYRRFAWKPLLAGTLVPPVYQPERSIVISGSVKTRGGKPIPDAGVTLFTTSTADHFILDTIADNNGNFAFKDLFLKDSIHFVIHGHTPNGSKDVDIKMDDNGSEDLAVKSEALSAINFNASDQLFAAYLKANKNLYNEERKYGLADHVIVLKQVTINDRQISKVENSDNLNGPGHADQVITSEELDKLHCPTLDQCLNGLLRGVVFNNGRPYSTRRGIRAGPMLIIQDGMPMDDAAGNVSLSMISPDDVASIEVLSGGGYTAIYGSMGYNGVIIITTKRGPGNSVKAAQTRIPGIITYSPKGYYAAREFYSPQYDNPKINRSLADLRTTIYWKPNLITDKTGHTFFEYYNAGSPGTYRVIIEGIDSDGHLGREVYRYKVK